MAGIKAGTAYVQLELSGLNQFRQQMNAGVSAAAQAAGTAASKALAGSVSAKQAAANLSSQLVSGTSNAGSIVGSRLSSTIASFMNSGGVTASRSFVSTFTNGLAAVYSGGSASTFLRGMGALGLQTGRQIMSSVTSGLKGLAPVVSGAFTSGFAAAGSAVSAVTSSIARIPGMMSTASAAVTSFGRQIGTAAYQAQNLGLLLSVAFTAPVVGISILGAVIGVKFAAQIEDAQIALKALLPAGYDVAALVKRLQQQAIASPVFDSASVIVFTQRMVAAGIEIGKTERFLKAFGNIAVTAGVPMDKMTLALQAFSQMAGKGVVNMEELRQQLGDALPGALKIAADGLGITQAQLFKLVKQGKITADDIMNAFIKVGESAVYANGAAAGAESLRSKWNQLVETVQSKLADAVLKNMTAVKGALASVLPSVELLISSFGKHLPGAINAIGSAMGAINSLIDRYKALSESDRELVKLFLKVAVVAGPLVLIFGAFGTAIAGMAAGLSVLISPVSAVIIAVLGVAFALYSAWKAAVEFYNKSAQLREIVDRISTAFTSYLLPTLTKVAGIIKDSLLDAWANLSREIVKNKDNIDGIMKVLKILAGVALVVVGVVIGVLVGIAKAIGPILTAIVSLITGVMQIVNGIINFFYHLATGQFGALKRDLLQIWNGLWDAIVGTVFNLGKAVWNFISGFVEAIVGFFEMLYDVLVGHSIVPDLINSVISWFTSLPGKVLGAISSFVSSVISKFIEISGKVLATISGMIDRAVDFFSALPGKVISAIGNLGSTLYSTGRDLIQGLLNGIADMAGKLIDKARSVASSVKDAFKNVLDIGSPSREMMKIGRFVTQGLINGIVRDVADVRSAVSSVATGAITSVANLQGLQLSSAGTTGPTPSAGIHIENYNATEGSDPFKQAEAWAWINRTRGWSS